jgi:hypothetical protein
MHPEADWQRIYWLSGSPCAGKTSVSTALAQRFDWNVYHCDEWEGQQRHRAESERHPYWFAYSRLTGDELWLMPVQQHIAVAQRAYDEQFALILEDLAMFLEVDSRPLLYDGYVSPQNLAPLITTKAQAFYLIATEAFQVQYYEQRPWIDAILAGISNREKAWKNWMKRDASIAGMLEDEVQIYKMPYLLVDGSITLAETIERVANHFSGGLNVKRKPNSRGR